MRFRQFYSKLYFRVAVDLVGWPKTKIHGGSVSNTGPHFFTTVVEDRLKKQFTFSVLECKLTGRTETSAQRIQWLLLTEKNRVPEYPDKNDPRFNLTGVAAVRRCVEETLFDTINKGDILVETTLTLEQIIDLDTVNVTAIMIP